MRETIDNIKVVAELTVSFTSLDVLHQEAVQSGISDAVAAHDSAALFDWLVGVVSYQGIADAIAARYMDEHGRVSFDDLARALRTPPPCPRLHTLLAFRGLPLREAHVYLLRTG